MIERFEMARRSAPRAFWLAPCGASRTGKKFSWLQSLEKPQNVEIVRAGGDALRGVPPYRSRAKAGDGSTRQRRLQPRLLHFNPPLPRECDQAAEAALLFGFVVAVDVGEVMVEER